MPDQEATATPQEVSIEVTVIRADGSREERGVVAYWNKNPLKRAAWAVKQKLRSTD